MAIALVTGPTAGIGKAFAVALARAGFDLVLVARDETRLAQLAASLAGQFGVQAEVLVADLGDALALAKVEERLGRADRPISVLVNNAGFGVKASFSQSDIHDEQQLLVVLVRSVMRTTHAAVPGFRRCHQCEQHRELDNRRYLFSCQGLGNCFLGELGSGVGWQWSSGDRGLPRICTHRVS